jgi:hypothetical protein
MTFIYMVGVTGLSLSVRSRLGDLVDEGWPPRPAFQYRDVSSVTDQN